MENIDASNGAILIHDILLTDVIQLNLINHKEPNQFLCKPAASFFMQVTVIYSIRCT